MPEETLSPPAVGVSKAVVQGRQARMRWLRRFGEPFLVVVVILAIFEVLVRSGVIDSHALPAPTTIVASFFDDIQHGAVWSALGGTLLAWVVGMLGVIVIGVPLGMLLGLNRTVYSATQPTFEFIRTVPSIAALPLLILLFGISARLAELMVFVGAIWPVLIQAMYGVQDVDPAAKDLGRAYGLGRLRLFFQIVLPSSLPYVITGFRLASIIGLLLSVSASLLAGGNGIGLLISKAQFSDDPGLIYARIMLVGLVGLIVSLTVNYLARKVLFWHASQREVLT